MKNVIRFSTIISISYLITVLCWLPNRVVAQASVFGNVPSFGAYLGWDDAQDLEFRTNNTTYMQLMQNGTNTVDGYTYNHDGFLLLSSDPTAFNHKPFSLLHLYGGKAEL